MIFSGIGLLIFAYLLANNSDAFSKISRNFAASGSGIIATLQGRGGSNFGSLS